MIKKKKRKKRNSFALQQKAMVLDSYREETGFCYIYLLKKIPPVFYHSNTL